MQVDFLLLFSFFSSLAFSLFFMRKKRSVLLLLFTLLVLFVLFGPAGAAGFLAAFFLRISF